MADSKPHAPKRLLSPNERRVRNREEVIQGILDTACAVLRDDGVAALNMHEVARRLGMRAQSLYGYFPIKTALYEALLLMGLRRYNNATAQPIAQYGWSWDLIPAAWTTFMQF